MNLHILRGLLAAGVLGAVSSVHAAGPDFAAMTGAIDLASVITAILAIGLILVGPAVAKKGVRMVLSMLGR